MIKKNKLLLLSIFIASFSYSQSYNIEGDWYTENNDAIIKIYKDGNTLSGKITWMKTPNDKNGNPIWNKEQSAYDPLSPYSGISGEESPILEK